MKRFFQILGILAFAAIIGFGVLIYLSSRLAPGAESYVEDSVRVISSHWDLNELRKRATPDLMQHLNDDKTRNFFDTLARLGPLVEYKGTTGGTMINVSSSQGAVGIGKYDASAKFANAEAVFHIVIIRRNDAWRIDSFYVDSSVFAPDQKRTIQGT